MWKKIARQKLAEMIFFLGKFIACRWYTMQYTMTWTYEKKHKKHPIAFMRNINDRNRSGTKPILRTVAMSIKWRHKRIALIFAHFECQITVIHQIIEVEKKRQPFFVEVTHQVDFILKKNEHVLDQHSPTFVLFWHYPSSFLCRSLHLRNLRSLHQILRHHLKKWTKKLIRKMCKNSMQLCKFCSVSQYAPLAHQLSNIQCHTKACNLH